MKDACSCKVSVLSNSHKMQHGPVCRLSDSCKTPEVLVCSPSFFDRTKPGLSQCPSQLQIHQCWSQTTEESHPVWVQSWALHGRRSVIRPFMTSFWSCKIPFFFFFLIYYPREGAFQNEETVLRLAGLRRKFLIHDLFYWHSEIRFLQQSLQI